MTDLAGFDQTKGEEWKIMGLAPYGRRDPDLLALLRRLFRIEGRRLIFADAADDPGSDGRDPGPASGRRVGNRLGRPLARAGRMCSRK